MKNTGANPKVQTTLDPKNEDHKLLLDDIKGAYKEAERVRQLLIKGKRAEMAEQASASTGAAASVAAPIVKPGGFGK